MRFGVFGVAALGVLGCGAGAATGAVGEPAGAVEADVRSEPEPWEAASPVARARAGGWTGESLERPPHYCNDEGGTEWCDGKHDDNCDGTVDEGCVDCVNATCVRFEISEEQMRRGAGRSGTGECVGPVYCGRIDGVATTSPPGGCGHHHCGTVIWEDRTAQPFHCTIYGRCVDGEFEAREFSW